MREFRAPKRGGVDYRCHRWQRSYNFYTGPIFASSNPDPRRVGLFVRGVGKGEPATALAEDLTLSRQGVHRWRKRLQANGDTRLSPGALPNVEPETAERCQNAGKKRRQPLRPVRSAAPPRHQTPRARHLPNDRPPIVGTVGRESGQWRVRVREHTEGKTLPQHVHDYPKKAIPCSTEEWQGYNRSKRAHHTVCHSQKEWARDTGPRSRKTALRGAGKRQLGAIVCVRLVL